MPAVKKPKPQKIEKQSTPTKKPEQTKTVVSGQLKKKLKPQDKPQQKIRQERGVIFVKHLPHGFFEQQLRQYFKQFGHVTRLRLARSERTGGSKGFAFVEFEYPEVAEVAAKTMDNYLMFQKVVKAKYIPPDQQKFNYFKNTVKKVKNKAGKEIYVSELTKATQHSVKKQNNWNESACQKRTVAGMKKLNKLQQKYKHLGIDLSNSLVEPTKKAKEAASTSDGKPADAKKPAPKGKKQEKALKLEDLLGNTINEDSDDEDYVDDDSEDEAELSSDLSGVVDSDEVDEEEMKPLPTPAAKKSKKRNTGEERLTDLLKRKPGTGGVQKKKKPAAAAKVPKTAATQKLQLATAKKIAKPLQKVGKKLKK